MTVPSWDDPKLKHGTMVRCGLWLVQVVGEGGTFTKEDLRRAFPGVAQADRRMRDLRDYGWVIHTNTEEPLAPEQQRFVQQGVPVWDPAKRRAASPEKAITSKERQAALERDEYMCTVCGVGAAETYPDDSNQSAVLGVSRRKLTSLDGRSSTVLVKECKRCRAGAADTAADPEEALTLVKRLDPAERRRMAFWISRGRRGASDLDRAWAAYRRLPEQGRQEVREFLA